LVTVVYKPLLADAENVVLCYVADIQFVIVIKNMLGGRTGDGILLAKRKKEQI